MQAVCHSSALVRSAAQAGLSELPYCAYRYLPQSQHGQIWQWVWDACQNDEAAAVRAAAAKGLGHLAGGVPVQCCQSGVPVFGLYCLSRVPSS